MKKVFALLSVILFAFLLIGQASGQQILPVPSRQPNDAQLKQIERKYGMFMHFGINTFHDMEWTDGTKPAASYNPKTIDADQWIKTAKNAGMKYVILVTKHHDGFCLWDSKYTDYDVANSGNKTNVVEAVAKACKKQGIGLGFYYSLWDRNKNSDTKNVTLDSAYNAYIINQLNELLDIAGKYTIVVEFWFDGGWEKENYRWPVKEIYQTIKSREPECQVGINWSIGLPGNPDYHLVEPKDQKERYPIRYFPSDFRLGDPYLPVENDPKIFSNDGNEYYMPWESTVCIRGKWFYDSTDTIYKSVDELVKLYRTATAQDNILILNYPPNREGKMRKKDIEILMTLKKHLAIKP
jgi:alpha-L-fucosidase